MTQTTDINPQILTSTLAEELALVVGCIELTKTSKAADKLGELVQLLTDQRDDLLAHIETAGPDTVIAFNILTERSAPDMFGNIDQRGNKRFRVQGNSFPQHIGRITKTRQTINGQETEGDAYSFAGCLVMDSSGHNDGIASVPVLPNGSTISIDGELFTVHASRRYNDDIDLRKVAA
jgi:hypothetical protein